MNKNIKKLIKLTQLRLLSKGKMKKIDESGNMTYIDFDLYGEEVLEEFLNLSLSSFNQIPNFTNFSFEDDDVVNTFAEVLVEGAIIHALGSRALLEKGREYNFSDTSLSYTPPNLSDMLDSQYNTLLHFHLEKVKYIKERIFSFWTKGNNVS